MTSALKSDEVKEKVRQTCLNKYGTTSPLKNKDIKEKIKETCLKKYGVINPISNPLIYNKVKNTCISKYGVPYLMQNIKIKNKSKETCIKKYGISNAGGSIEVQNKIKQTILNHYGVDCYFKTKECRNKSNSPEIIQKIIETKRKNHTFNTSKPEEELYLYIKGKFPNVKRQYKDKERYPWCCDFYISELDYFIELQGYYTHGKHPYNPNSEEDNKLIEKYKRKYGPNCQAITIWTIKDVEKRNKAKEEKLNFKEVWTLEEGKEFIDSLFYANTKSENRTN